jgi:hypothetical protein
MVKTRRSGSTPILPGSTLGAPCHRLQVAALPELPAGDDVVVAEVIRVDLRCRDVAVPDQVAADHLRDQRSLVVWILEVPTIILFVGLRIRVLIVTLGVIAGCSSAGPSPDEVPEASSAVTPDAIVSDQPVVGSPPLDAAELYPGFEFDRVRQMATSDLPPGIPVPVPAGGTIDPSLSASEGELLAIDYDPRFARTAVAFYGTWLATEAIQASPLFGSDADGGGWEFEVGGVPVRIEIGASADGTATKVIIYWG